MKLKKWFITAVMRTVPILRHSFIVGRQIRNLAQNLAQKELDHETLLRNGVV